MWIGRPDQRTRKPEPKETGEFCLSLQGQDIPLTVTRNAQAKRLILRLASDGQSVRVTLPAGVSMAEARRFARDRADWIMARLAMLEPPVPFTLGSRIPLGDDWVIISPWQGGPGVVERCGDELRVKGKPEHLARRLTDWFRKEARNRIDPLVRTKAEAAGVQAGKITIRDTKSRWGSCSSTGNLSFSWRLVLAPSLVLDYVVAHEVAHLRHHNHGPAFHALNRELALDARAARTWLKHHGRELHRYG